MRRKYHCKDNTKRFLTNSFLQLVTYYFENVGNRKVYYMVKIFLEQMKFYETLQLFANDKQLFFFAHYNSNGNDSGAWHITPILANISTRLSKITEKWSRERRQTTKRYISWCIPLRSKSHGKVINNKTEGKKNKTNKHKTIKKKNLGVSVLSIALIFLEKSRFYKWCWMKVAKNVAMARVWTAENAKVAQTWNGKNFVSKKIFDFCLRKRIKENETINEMLEPFWKWWYIKHQSTQENTHQ